MFFLDANVFYSYIGRKNLGLIESLHVNEGKLRRFLDTVKEKSLPTSVFIEVMVHFRDDPKKLRKILDFRMFQKHNYNKYQTEYLRTIMFTAWFDRAQKLRKNDIFDMMCAGCLAYVRPILPGESMLLNSESYIISFDKTMESFIKSVKSTNAVIIDEYKNAK